VWPVSPSLGGSLQGGLERLVERFVQRRHLIEPVEVQHPALVTLPDDEAGRLLDLALGADQEVWRSSSPLTEMSRPEPWIDVALQEKPSTGRCPSSP
jgi:hypothetical protein